MNRFLVTLTICVTILLGLSMLSPLPAQQQPAQPPEVGRYQLMGGGGTGVYLLDTATGRVWGREHFHTGWRDRGNPVEGRQATP